MSLRPEDESVLRLLAVSARDLLSGRLDLAEGIRQIANRARALPDAERDAFATFLGVDSEIDDYPTGKTRAAFSPSYIARVEAEVGPYLERHRELLLSECRTFLAMAKQKALAEDDCVT